MSQMRLETCWRVSGPICRVDEILCNSRPSAANPVPVSGRSGHAQQQHRWCMAAQRLHLVQCGLAVSGRTWAAL
jgi:hypothetical protein